MVRAPAIRGRPAQARKYKATLTSSALTTSSPARLATAKVAVPKALKRAEKRASLLAKASDAENKGARALLSEGEYSISKSSIRRRKRKARDEIGKNIEEGREGGVREIMDVVDDLEQALHADDEAQADGMQDVRPNVSITANQRRKVLTQEKARQNAILNDPAYKASPFEALRMHARTAMATSTR